MSKTSDRRQAAARKHAAAEDEDRAPEHEGARLGKSVIVNAPTHQNSGGFENQVAAPVHAPADKTAGTNATMAANLFEQRVVQEQGTH